MDLLFRKRRKKAQPACAALGPVTDELGVELAIKAFYIEREQGSEKSPAEFAKQFPAIEAMLLADLEFEESLITLNEAGLLDEASSAGALSSWHEQPADNDIPWPKVGETVGEFILEEQIGRGKFSRVFAARTVADGPEVAVKICRHLGKHEARTLAEVAHSAIGVIEGVETFPESELIAIFMPLKSRTTLADVLRCVRESNSIPASAEAVWDEVQSRNKLHAAPLAWSNNSYVGWAHNVMTTLAEALSSAHQQSTAHCDIKPSNVLVTAEGSPVLIDFNLSLRWDVESSSPNIGGTMPYMSPEQIQAFDAKQQGNIGPRTDIYGLAATMYQLLTGELPFESTPDESVSDILMRRKKRTRSVHRMNPRVSASFSSVIMECLSYDPKGRPHSAADLVARLNQVSPVPSDSESPRRRITATAVASLATVAVVSVLLFAIAFPPASSSELPALAITSDKASEQVAPDVNKLLNDGYDAYEAGDYEAAMKKFETVLAINPEHDGAAIGCARSQFKLGDTEAAALMVHRLPVEGTASVSAIRGLCLAANSHYELAVASFRTAIADGLESRELLTDLAYCLCQSAQPKEAVEVLERVRRMGHDTSIANLILVRAYQMKWRQQIKGEKRPEFDTELLVNLIEECKESPARSHTAAIFYSSLASRFGRTDESVRSHWTKKAQSEFARGCELGLDPSYADDIKHVNRELITAIQHSPKSTLQHRVFYLLDPLTGTRFERCTEQSLARHH